MSELRYDPVKRSWVIIASERGLRPNHFIKREVLPSPKSCPFCPGFEHHTPPEIMRVADPESPGGKGWRVRVVPNKFPALTIERSPVRMGKGLYDVVDGFGAHEVIIETPREEQQMADLSLDHLRDVFFVYRERLSDLMHDQRFRSILLFKNHGSEAGASLPHSHSQLIAMPVSPNMIITQLASSLDYFTRKERCLFCDLLAQEMADRERVVLSTERFVVYAPFASSFPFELRIFPKTHLHDYARVDEEHLRHFAAVVKETLLRLRRVLNDPPFNFILHTSPPTTRRPGKPEYWGSIERDFHWHLELTPRLTKIAGFEWGTGFYINPTAPEEAARYMREALP